MRIGRFLKSFALPATVLLTAGGAQAAAPPREKTRFVSELVRMLMGDRDKVSLTVGYPIHQMHLIDNADLEQVSPATLHNNQPIKNVFQVLDPAILRMSWVAPGEGLTAVLHEAVPTAERLNIAHDTLFAAVRRENPRAPLAERASALAVFTHITAESAQLRQKASFLLDARPMIERKISRRCTIYQAVDASGYVDGIVASVQTDSRDMFDLRVDSTRACLMAAQISNIGFSDAVGSGRFRRFPTLPAEMAGCYLEVERPGERAKEQAPCYSPYTGRVYYAVASYLVRAGKLKSGVVERRELGRLAASAYDDFTAETIARIEATDRSLPRSLSEARKIIIVSTDHRISK